MADELVLSREAHAVVRTASARLTLHEYLQLLSRSDAARIEAQMLNALRGQPLLDVTYTGPAGNTLRAVGALAFNPDGVPLKMMGIVAETAAAPRAVA